MFNLAENLRRQRDEQPDKVALVLDDRTLTFAEFDREATQVAHALAAAGVGNQDRVGFIGKNIAEYFTLTYGAAKLNAVIVAVNWRLAPPEMDYILDHAEAKLVAVEGEFLGHLDAMDLGRSPMIVAIGGETDRQQYADWIGGASTDDVSTPFEPGDTSVQLYTSGTTGLPKGAELSNHNLEASVPPLTEVMGLQPEDVVLHVLPMFHIGGSGVAHAAVYRGCTSIVHRDVDPGRIFADIPGYGVTTAFMVPALLQVLPIIPGASDVDFSSLKTILYGASPISEEALVGSMALLKCDHAQVYGLTETTGAVTYLAPEDHDPGGDRAGLLRSAGKTVVGTEVRIVDEDGNDVAEGEVGEIWSRSHQNLKGYWRNPEATAAAFPEGRDDDGLGWFASGDAGYVKDGFVYIHDRVKDMIVSGGENVYPREVEDALYAHPAIADAAVIGVPDEQWGDPEARARGPRAAGSSGPQWSPSSRSPA